MKSYLLRLQEELYDQIETRAKKNGRSVNSEIVAALKSTVSIPVVGQVQEDGKVYWDIPAGIEQSR